MHYISIQIVYLEAYANRSSRVQVTYGNYILTCSIRAKYVATFKCIVQAENSMTGRACMGEVLIQVWLKSIKKCMGQQHDKQVYA